MQRPAALHRRTILLLNVNSFYLLFLQNFWILFIKLKVKQNAVAVLWVIFRSILKTDFDEYPSIENVRYVYEKGKINKSHRSYSRHIGCSLEL